MGHETDVSVTSLVLVPGKAMTSCSWACLLEVPRSFPLSTRTLREVGERERLPAACEEQGPEQMLAASFNEAVLQQYDSARLSLSAPALVCLK